MKGLFLLSTVCLVEATWFLHGYFLHFLLLSPSLRPISFPEGRSWFLKNALCCVLTKFLFQLFICIKKKIVVIRSCLFEIGILPMCLKRSPQIQVRIRSFQDHARYRGSRDIMAPRECAKKLLEIFFSYCNFVTLTS